MISVVRRWRPKEKIVLVTDAQFGLVWLIPCVTLPDLDTIESEGACHILAVRPSLTVGVRIGCALCHVLCIYSSTVPPTFARISPDSSSE
jgi:hypothetical protein